MPCPHSTSRVIAAAVTLAGLAFASLPVTAQSALTAARAAQPRIAASAVSAPISPYIRSATAAAAVPAAQKSSMRSTAEISMLDLQAQTAKRSTALTTTTTIMNSLNDSQSTIAKNMAGGGSGSAPTPCKACATVSEKKP